MLEHCRSPRIPLPKKGFECFIRQIGYENIKIEVLNKKPPILRLPQFLLDKSLSAIAHRFRTSRSKFAFPIFVDFFAFL